MRRTWLLICGTTLAVTGCSGGSTTPVTVTVTEAATSEEASSIEPSNDVLASQFHPCEVLTQEQFENAGLIELVDQDTDLGTLASGCTFRQSNTLDLPGIWMVATDTVDREYVRALSLETIDWGTKKNPDIYVQQVSLNARQCEAANDYDWGRLTVTYFETGEVWEPEILCPGAVQTLDNLLEEIEGNK
ncbi:hypothetical protein N24_2372 [Corynebacterium suranareeae]|uniref:DUF3558 domain-containing protein n=1 Tax=Corynebacterium suranareeae TaxID=2506452 RepID=A0A160PSE0_9CORY|nr:DUF3558 family protein [Corynebacterium suranareeae]BAU96634.1 hypothetical protein N24_2372 [Corynebacterium suranareeae]